MAGVLAGTAATTLLDSSSVTIIMTIALVSAGLLTFTQSLGVVINIGTVILGVIFAAQLAQVAQWLAFGADVPRQIANAHVLFNVLGVVLVIGFTPWIVRGLERLIPDRADDHDADRREQFGAPVEA